ncbi:MAG TPA: hypothetical protein VFU31_22190 [Candidatus Binatia bacterium]|nr:hypothetical protein [Candidatus Binatia bacterium]
MQTKSIPFSFPFIFLLVGSLQALGPWRASETNTRGWQFMTPEERIEHQAKVRGFRTYEECRAYQMEHHQLMEARAKQRGMALPSGGRDFCAHLKPGSQ